MYVGNPSVESQLEDLCLSSAVRQARAPRRPIGPKKPPEVILVEEPPNAREPQQNGTVFVIYSMFFTHIHIIYSTSLNIKLSIYVYIVASFKL